MRQITASVPVFELVPSLVIAVVAGGGAGGAPVFLVVAVRKMRPMLAVLLFAAGTEREVGGSRALHLFAADSPSRLAAAKRKTGCYRVLPGRFIPEIFANAYRDVSSSTL